jgi:ABC-type amino acid transport substrate-binding protein
MKRILAVLAAALLLPALAGAQTLDKIRKSGVITLGYIDGATPFSFTDGNGSAGLLGRAARWPTASPQPGAPEWRAG